MGSFKKYSLGVLLWLNTAVCFAADKFDVLPELPDTLMQKAEASTISGTTSTAVLGAQSVGHEPSLVSVFFSLAFVVLLIYLTGILYTKLNKVGFKTLKRQQGELSKLQVSVISTTQLGGNKTLHVVELDGKRMLIGASAGAMQLIKDLGSANSDECEEEYSRIEIPNIKIPKIEIPKIEIPSIGFSKIMTKAHKGLTEIVEETKAKADDTDTSTENLSNIQENSEGIIDSLFTQPSPIEEESKTDELQKDKHIVNPDEFSLYKKYLG